VFYFTLGSQGISSPQLVFNQRYIFHRLSGDKAVADGVGG
jgi:hypothetical protein